MEEAYNCVPGSSPEMAHLSLATSINQNVVTWSHGHEWELGHVIQPNAQAKEDKCFGGQLNISDTGVMKNMTRKNKRYKLVWAALKCQLDLDFSQQPQGKPGTVSEKRRGMIGIIVLAGWEEQIVETIPDVLQESRVGNK